MLRRVDFRIRPRFDFRGSGLGKTAKLAGWTVALVLANQVALLITARLATQANVLASEAGSTPEGLMTFDKAYLVFMLPVSVITISIVTSLLPRMSEQAAEGDLRAVSDQLVSGARLISALVLPAGAILIAAGPFVAQLIFGYGAGAGDAAHYTGVVISAFAVGLLPFSLFYLLIRGWYARQGHSHAVLRDGGVQRPADRFMLGFFQVAPTGPRSSAWRSPSPWPTGSRWSWRGCGCGANFVHMHTWDTIWALIRMYLAGLLAIPVAFLGTLVADVLVGAIPGDWLETSSAGRVILPAVALGTASIVGFIAYVLFCRPLRVPDVDEVLGMVRAKLPFPARRRTSED